MYLGEGTPVEVLLAGTPPGSGKVGLSSSVPSNKKDTPDNTVVTGLTDLVDLSDDARALLESTQEALQTLEKGQKELVRQETELLHARLEQVEEQVDILKELLQRADAEQAKPILRGIEQAGEALQGIGRQLGLVQPVAREDDVFADVISEFRTTTQSFTEFIQEYQDAFHDESRIPPSLFIVVEGLIKAALEKPDASQGLDKLA